MTIEEKEKAYDGFIEIPFGAFDSETIGWTYTIPEGFTAKIEDGKIIVEKKESDDERIRKAIKCYVEDMPDSYGFAHGIGKKEMLAYLEKQKEQTPEEWSEEDETGLIDALDCVEKARKVAKDEGDMGNCWYAEKWLNSLRPQPHWKPSEEQMYSLGTVVKGYDNSTVGSVGYNLKELYEDLKKL